MRTVFILFMSGILLGISNLLSAPPQSDKKPDQIRIYALDGGISLIEDKSIFHPAYSSCDSITLRVTSFLIVHPEGTILWDTGMPGKAAQIEKQLHEIGINPEKDIDFLAFSHWHYDHTGNANHFDNSIIIGQADEYYYAFSQNAVSGFGMNPETYSGIANNHTLLFIGDYDVFNDGRVQILRVGGHTMGSQILMVKLREKTVILSGDIFHFTEQRIHRRVPSFNHDSLQTINGMQRVENLLLQHSDSELWITHDPEQMGSLNYAPKYYD